MEEERVEGNLRKRNLFEMFGGENLSIQCSFLEDGYSWSQQYSGNIYIYIYPEIIKGIFLNSRQADDIFFINSKKQNLIISSPASALNIRCDTETLTHSVTFFFDTLKYIDEDKQLQSTHNYSTANLATRSISKECYSLRKC